MNSYASNPVSDAQSEFVNRKPADLRHEIEASKEALTDTIKRIDERMHRAVDWRAHVRDYPLVAVGAVAVGGMLLAGLFSRRPSPRERIVDAIAESVEDITDNVRHRIGRQLTRTMTGSLVKAAVMTVVAKKATEYLCRTSTNVLNSDDR
jgi:ElaB/YqjD/DUF883 family membrane-anchored ribosome-binding protein